MKAGTSLAFLILLFAAFSARAKEIHATVVYDDRPTEIASAREEVNQLWITTADLRRATRFEVKPQGVCRDELCFPLPKAKQQEFLRKETGGAWFNLTAFAALVRQPVAHDEALAVWYFGLRGDQRQILSSLQAPDFKLPDINGKPHSLSDFRGKKVLLVTWASW
jgi:hypothetical protein